MSKKIIVDILLGVLMILEFSRIYLSPAIHEIMGMALVVLLIIHLLLNRKYIKAIPKGKYAHKRALMLIVNLVFFIVFCLTIILGLLSSQNILLFLNIGNITTVYLHKIFAYHSLIVLGIHLGINIRLNSVKKIFLYGLFGNYNFWNLFIHSLGHHKPSYRKLWFQPCKQQSNTKHTWICQHSVDDMYSNTFCSKIQIRNWELN